MKRVVIAGGPELREVHAVEARERPDRVVGEIDAAQDGGSGSGGGVERQLAEVAIVLLMAALVPDVPDIERGLLPKLALNVERPRVGNRDLSLSINGGDVHGSDGAACGQRRREAIQVPAVQGRRRHQRRVAEAAEVVDILLNAFVKNARAGSNGGLAVAKRIVRDSQPGRPVVELMIHSAQGQALRPFLKKPVVRIAGTGDDGSLGNTGGGVDLH